MSLLMGIYAGATIVMLATCALAAFLRKQASDVFLAACTFILLTLASKMVAGVSAFMGYPLTPPASMIPYPVQDVMFLAVLAYSWKRHHDQWKLILGLLFSAQIVSHAFFWSAGDSSVHALWWYIVRTNVLYAMELVVLTSVGAGHVGAWVGAIFDGPRPYHIPRSLGRR